MPRILKAQIREHLHAYKKSVFELEHDDEKIAGRREKADKIAAEVLDQNFHYHLHRKVDPDRAETIQLIHNYCREALLPPVVEKLAERLLLLEQRHMVALEMVAGMLDDLAESDEATGGSA